MDKQKLHVVSFSGGKDSTAMLLRMLEEGWPVDVIMFCDTGLEFPALYRHLDKVEKNTCRAITRLKNPEGFEYLFSEKPIVRKKVTETAKKYGMNRKGYSWAGPKMRWCTQELKNQPKEEFLNRLREEYDVIEYVGLAADEEYRFKRKCNQRKNVRHPLVEWKMTEADCLKYCMDRGYDWEGLYTLFRRVSCWCCPLQSLRELRTLYHNFPDLWQQLRLWDENTWRSFRADYSIKQLEQRFDFEDRWLADGHPDTQSKAFFLGLKELLERNTDESSDH